MQQQHIKQNQEQQRHTTKHENPLPFEIQELPEHLAQKYQIIQKDSITWQVSTKSKAPLMELRLIENNWWYPEYSDSKKETRYYSDFKFEVKTLCDSIRFDGLFFAFKVFDPIYKEQIIFQTDPIYIEQMSSYDQFMHFPKDYFFRKGERNTLYFRYTTKDIMQKDIGKDSVALRPSKVALKIQAMKTARPPVYKEKAIKVKNTNKYVELYELKEGFMEDLGSPYSIHFWAFKIRNKHPEKAIKTLGLFVYYYDKNKQLIKQGGDWIIHNLTEPLAAGTEYIYKLRTHLGENNYKNPPVVIEPKDIAYKEVEIHTLEWQ